MKANSPVTAPKNRIFRFEVIRDYIKAEIRNNALPAGAALPSFQKLSDSCNVSNITVRHAIRELEREGVLYSVPRKGIFVAKSEDQETEKSTKVFWVVLPMENAASSYPGHTASAFYHQLQYQAQQRHINLQFYFSNDQPGEERKFLEQALQMSPDGLLVLPANDMRNSDLYQALLEQGTRVIELDRFDPHLDTNVVSTDNFAGAYSAVCQLAEQGLKSITHITSEIDNYTIRARRDGYEEAIARYGLKSYVISISADQTPFPAINETDQITRGLLRESSGELGFFTQNSVFAQGVWQAIYNLGHPEDWARIALATFDQPDFPLPPNFKVIKILQQFDHMAGICLDMLQESKDTPPRRMLIKPKIVNITGNPE